MSETNTPRPEPTTLREPGAETPQGSIWMRGLAMLLIALLVWMAQAVLQLLTLVQFILMLLDKGKPNAQIASFGKSLGAWLAKAARFQTAQSEERPWPWTSAD